MGKNEEPKVVEKSAEEFIDAICGDVRRGWGFTPLIGAGASSRSGILMGLEFTEYLSYAVYRCVVQEKTQRDALGSEVIRLWNVSEDGWPDAPRPFEVDKVRKWVFDEYTKLCDQCGLTVNRVNQEENWVLSISSKEQQDRPIQSATPAKAGADVGKEHGTLGPATMDKQIRRPLLPRILRLPGQTQVDDESVKRFLRNLGAENAARGLLLDPDISPDSEAGLTERAIRSLHDWRAMLLFLAELHAVYDEIGRRRAFLGKANPNVIDLFGAFITQGRKPNLTHSMLGHLTGPMRMRLVLTTNFDTLLEDAFAQLNLSFRDIPVGTKASLPDPKTIHAQNTILKLHGSLTDIRADFSLDEAPSTEEKDKFFDYVVGRRPGRWASEASAKTPTTGFLPSHLLVIGFRGDDRRIMHLLKHVLDHSSDIRIFWICHSKSDSEALNLVFSELDYKNRIIATETDRSDLFLLELYQELTLSLPEGGFSYQYSHDAPPELWQAAEQERADLGAAPGGKVPEAQEPMGIVERVTQRSKTLQTRNLKESDTEVVAKNPIFTVKIAPSEEQEIDEKAKQSRNGLMVGFRQAFDKLSERRFNCVWLEMEDYADAYALAHTFLQVISLRLGLFQLEHAVLMPTRFKEALARQPRDKYPEFWRKHIKWISEYFRIQPEKWVLFLYGRNVPGICTGWARQSWEEAKYVDLKLFLEALCANKFIVIYAPYADERFGSDEAKFKKLVLAEAQLEKEGIYAKAPKSDPKPGEPADDEMHGLDCANVYPGWRDTVNDRLDPITIKCHPAEKGFDALIGQFVGAVTKPSGKPAATGQLAWLRLLYACSLFRRSRPITAFLTDGVLPPAYPLNGDGIDNDFHRHREVKKALYNFKREYIYRKPGGKIWVFRDTLFTMRAAAWDEIPGVKWHVGTCGANSFLDRHVVYAGLLHVQP